MTRSIAPAEAQRRLAAGEALLIDVREPAEFAAGHIPQAISLPLSTLPQALAELPHDKALIFQCRSGHRSGRACAVAAQARPGSTNLAGGIVAWRAAGLPVTGGVGARPPLSGRVRMIAGIAVVLLVIAGLSGVTAAFIPAAVVGGVLLLAGTTGRCAMARLLTRRSCDRATPGS